MLEQLFLEWRGSVEHLSLVFRPMSLLFRLILSGPALHQSQIIRIKQSLLLESENLVELYRRLSLLIINHEV